MSDMKFHDVANLFPLLEGEAFEQLKADIAANGQREPIWTHQDQIIDGRNRYRACEDLGLVPRFRGWGGQGSLVSFVVSLNLHRRHLTSGQAATIAVDVEAMLAEEAKERQREHGRTAPGKKKTLPEIVPEVIAPTPKEAREEAAKLTGTNAHYVTDAKNLKEEAPDLFEEVKAGKTTVPEASRKIKLTCVGPFGRRNADRVPCVEH